MSSEELPRDHEYTCPFCGSEAYECKAEHADARGDRFHCRTSMYHTFYPTDLHPHEPAKPPVPPQPEGDALVLRGGEVFRPVSVDDMWESTDTGSEVPWEWVSGEPFTVYRPSPSPERIEELVREFEVEFDLTAGGKEWVRSQVGALLGGES